MPRYARIEGGVVRETGVFPDLTGRFHPSLVWKPCGPTVQEGWLWDGTAFSAPPPPPPPPTPAELLDAEIARGLLARVLVEELAARFGTTRAALIAALKARL